MSTTDTEVIAKRVCFSKSMVVRRAEYPSVTAFKYTAKWTNIALRDGRASEMTAEDVSLLVIEQDHIRDRAGVLPCPLLFGAMVRQCRKAPPTASDRHRHHILSGRLSNRVVGAWVAAVLHASILSKAFSFRLLCATSHGTAELD